MPRSAPLPVVFVPGGITPVHPSYAPLLQELDGEIEPLLKDLELYAADEPAVDYSVQLEVDGLRRAVDAAGLDTFHLDRGVSRDPSLRAATADAARQIRGGPAPTLGSSRKWACRAHDRR